MTLRIRDIIANPLSYWGRYLFRKVYLEYFCGYDHLRIGYMSTAAKCDFGKYCTLDHNVSVGNITMGDFSYIGNYSTIYNTEIGKFSAISSNVKCGLGMHPSKDYISVHPIFYSTLGQSQKVFVKENTFIENKKTFIGNDVWVGTNCVIGDGITIGSGAIIGAGAVVTKDIPPYAIACGVPARVIRYRFSQEEISELLELKWWDKDILWLESMHQYFSSIQNIRTLGQ